MPLYTFRAFDGEQSTTSEATCFSDPDAAWADMVNVCADLVSGITRKLVKNSEWHLELLDEAQRPLFRISLTANAL
jgi:hypothetical protein